MEFRVFVLNFQLIKEFCKITGALETSFSDKWAEFETAIFKYTPFEEKRAVKNVMAEFNRYNSVDPDSPGIVYLRL